MTDPAFFLDSNICVYLLEGLSPLALRRIERCRPGEVVTSAIAYAEVVRGVDSKDAEAVAKVEALFGLVAVLPFDAAAARAYTEVPFKRGTFDRLIAAHALALGLTLVTNNEADFADVPGLKIENWTIES